MASLRCGWSHIGDGASAGRNASERRASLEKDDVDRPDCNFGEG